MYSKILLTYEAVQKIVHNSDIFLSSNCCNSQKQHVVQGERVGAILSARSLSNLQQAKTPGPSVNTSKVKKQQGANWSQPAVTSLQRTSPVSSSLPTHPAPVHITPSQFVSSTLRDRSLFITWAGRRISCQPK